jgi:hypothetical protein
VDWAFLLAAGLLLFFARDVLLIRRLTGAWGARKAFFFYFLVYFVVLLGSGKLVEFVSKEQALSLIADPRFWVPAVLVHGVLGWAFLRAQTDRPGAGWAVLVLAPAPVFLLSAAGLCWLALSTLPLSQGALPGAIFGVLWPGMVLGVARWGRSGHEAASPGAMGFAAASNLPAILLLPMHQQAGMGASGQPLDQGAGPLLGLLATAGLIAASFAFHRLRRAP